MKLEGVKISWLLFGGLGLILLLVAVLGGVAYHQSEDLWQETKGLYDHPFTVRRAVSELRFQVMAMEMGLAELPRAENETRRQELVQAIEGQEAAAEREMSVLYQRYLGPRSDLDSAARLLVLGKSQRAEIVDLLRLGNTAQAAKRAQSARAGADLLRHLQVISDFAVQRAERFYQAASDHRLALLTRLWLVVGAILLVASVIGALLLQAVRKPLKDLAGVAEAYREGSRQARSRYVSGNEFGRLGAAFNQLLDAVRDHEQRLDGAALVAQALLGNDRLSEFCRGVLQALLRGTDSQAGAIYLINEVTGYFEHYQSVGLGDGARASFAPGEGQLGQALAHGQVGVINDIPADTPFKFATLAGEFQPRALMTIPIMAQGQAVAAICLASLSGYTPRAVRLMDDTMVTISARLGGVMAFQQVRQLASRLEEQNRELETQQKELSAQTAELSQQNMELQLQKRQLDQANRLKSSFLANMSHELRTPLNSVIALSGVLERRLAGKVPTEEHGYLRVIERNAKQLLRLINDLLDLSRVEAGREQVRPSVTQVSLLAAEVVSSLELQAREKGLALHNKISPDLPSLFSDVDKCRQILLNLVGNAIKFTEIGQVELSASLEGQTMLVKVADTGIGISAEDLPLIFDEFRQAEEGASRRFGGTGLGLAIAKKYATLLGGTITVFSHPGQGSIFTLRLPLSLPTLAPGSTPPPLQAEPLAADEPSAGEGGRVLVVEDSEPAIIQLTDILAGQGYEVLVARDGRQALELVGRERPHAVILDLMMPEVDGFQVLKSIRQSETDARVPVLILTAKHVTAEELSFLEGNNIHQLIQKGDISRQSLLAAVARMMPRGDDKTATEMGHE